MILALDTAAGVSAALLTAKGQVLAEQNREDLPGEQVAAVVEALLSEAGCTAADVREVIVGVGPGPFTGLRVGLAFAEVFALALGISVRGVCSLDALGDSDGLVVSNARRKELYWAVYQGGQRIDGPAVSSPDSLAKLATQLPVRGPGAGMYVQVPGEFVPLRAAALAQRLLGRPELAQPVAPMYLRAPDATPPTQRKRVSDG